MERLTEKYNDGYITKNYFAYSKTNNELKEDNYNALCKLGKLEDIEEELGIDIITLFKALENGIYYQTNGYLVRVRLVKLAKICSWCLTDGNHYADTINYKSKWWLKEDKSE